MNDSHRVVVVGAGASGMAAAIAASVSGAHVCLLESLPKPGRKIMASGNGRCNFANADLSPERYNDPAFVAAAMGDRPLDPIVDFFSKLGLWYTTDDEGRMYPRSRAAASVLDVLMAALDEYGVELRLNSRVSRVDANGGNRPSWRLQIQDGQTVDCNSVVWAAGGSSAKVLKESLRVPCTPERPALCPLALDPKPPKSLDGVRVSCAVEIWDGRSMVTRQEGEVLFRPYGISGIVIFDLSRLAYRGDTLVLDLLPDISSEELVAVLQERLGLLGRCVDGPDARLRFLDGALHPKIARYIMERHCGVRGERKIEPSGLAASLKSWRFKVSGAADESHAQITQGGLSLECVDPLTMGLRGHSGLFACGESLDVDGECGGLNLAWAWSSGMIAGVSAARHSGLTL